MVGWGRGPVTPGRARAEPGPRRAPDASGGAGVTWAGAALTSSTPFRPAPDRHRRQFRWAEPLRIKKAQGQHWPCALCSHGLSGTVTGTRRARPLPVHEATAITFCCHHGHYYRRRYRSALLGLSVPLWPSLPLPPCPPTFAVPEPLPGFEPSPRPLRL